MNSCELTASITALANALAYKLTEDELTLLGVTLTQLGDTLLTIVTQRSICKKTYEGGHHSCPTRSKLGFRVSSPGFQLAGQT